MLSGSVRRNATIAAAVACLTISASTSLATVIPLGTNSGWQAVIPDAQDPFVDIVVDGQTSDTLRIEKSAEFFGPLAGGVLPPVDILFQQTGPSTISHIVIDDEIITNSTGVAWTDFHMEIIGTGAAFNPALTLASGGPPPIGWTITPFTTASFGAANHTLDIAGGVVANGAQWFPGDAPGGDGSLFIDVVSLPSAPFTSFTLREQPTVPEPALLGIPLAAALMVRASDDRAE